MTKLPLILIGGGGHCRSCIDVIEQEGKYLIEGIIDDAIAEEKVMGYPVVGGDNKIEVLSNKRHFFLITVGQIKSAAVRVNLYDKLKSSQALLATIISPRSYVAKSAIIEKGTIVMHGAIVNSGAHIGENSILNTLSLVEHDAVIEKHVHVSTGAILNGGCTVGSESFIGSGSVVANGVNICSRVIVGARSTVINHITIPGIYVGSPAKKNG